MSKASLYLEGDDVSSSELSYLCLYDATVVWVFCSLVDENRMSASLKFPKRVACVVGGVNVSLVVGIQWCW